MSRASPERLDPTTSVEPRERRCRSRAVVDLPAVEWRRVRVGANFVCATYQTNRQDVGKRTSRHQRQASKWPKIKASAHAIALQAQADKAPANTQHDVKANSESSAKRKTP